VTDCTSNLVYQDESGALNESFSDQMGNAAEFFAAEPTGTNCVRASLQTECADWWIGEDVYLPADTVPGFRNMADPEEDGDPDHYTERQIGGGDNGGVHSNSGIPNHAFYLLLNGGLNASCASPATHNAAHCSDADTQDNLNVTSIGITDAEKIFFLAFTSLPTDATMCQARTASESQAVSLFGAGSQQKTSTHDAWVAVGLTDLACGSTAPLTITTTSLPAGTVGQPYSATVQATGGTTPYTWSIASGVLPTGLSLDASTGLISGTPTTASTYSFTATVSDNSAPPQTASKALSIVVNSTAPLTITTTSLAAAKVGQPYSATVQATGGTTPYTWSIASGALPTGLSLDASTGLISGTPTKPGKSSFSILVSDISAPQQTASKALSIKIGR
jgi:hypothetical protein